MCSLLNLVVINLLCGMLEWEILLNTERDSFVQQIKKGSKTLKLEGGSIVVLLLKKNYTGGSIG